MRIAVLCNDRLGLPALQQLAQGRLLHAAGASDRSPEIVAVMQQLHAQAGVPVQIFTRKGFEGQLLQWLDAHRPDVVLVKTFPFRIPGAALRIPKHGFINFHYAPLPAWRGPNPLFWMIRQGLQTGGITVHRMDEDVDTGPILLSQPVPFPPGGSYGMCATQLAFAGAALTPGLLQGLHAGALVETLQDAALAMWHRRPVAGDLLIQWDAMDATEALALVKACNPWNKGAATRFKGWTIGITDASIAEDVPAANALPGTIISLNENEGFVIACARGTALRVAVVYTEEGFFAGARTGMFGLKPGDRLE